MRVFAESAYAIAPEQVVGSSGRVKLEMRYGQPVPVKLPEVSSSTTVRGSRWESTSTSGGGQ